MDRTFTKIQGFPFSRSLKYFVLMTLDAILLVSSLWLSLLIVDGGTVTLEIRGIVLYFLLFPAIGVMVFLRLGVYRTILLYIGIRSALLILKAVALVTLILSLGAYLDAFSPFSLQSIPVFGMIALLFVGGARVCLKLFLQGLVQNFRPKESVIIYGAGSSGTQLAAALMNGGQYVPVAFVDDDEEMIGTTVHGVRVNPHDALGELIKNFSVRQILLALPSATHNERKQILTKLEHFPVHVKTVPDLFSMVAGKAGVDQIREVDIEDLLGRNVVPPYPHLMSACIQDKSIMITGAGGSIGSELSRQIIKLQPSRIVLFDNSEFGLYTIESDLNGIIEELGADSSIEVVAILGTVRDGTHVENVMRKFGVNTVYHAAAYKQLPMVEKNIVEGVQNNIFGTLTIAQAAEEVGVDHFVFVSTDKAVRPSSIMGATKRFAEQILQARAVGKHGVRYSMVRFGNVLGSSGSVVPLFRRQIRDGGPVTVTHPEVIRYFMTVQEASQLVIQAGSMASGGDVFVLDMDEPVKIMDLAHKMIHLMGCVVKNEENRHGDIEIEFTGLRPGEKLYEELLIGEAVTGTEHPKIMRAEEDYMDWLTLKPLMGRLNQACENLDQSEIREVLSEVIGGFVARPNEADPAFAGNEVQKESNENVTQLFS